MECGKLTAKLRDAVPVCFIENGKEVKRFKNIEIPDEIKKLPFQDFEFSVPVTGAITFKIMFEEGVLPKVWPEARTRKSRKVSQEEAPMPEKITAGLQAALEQAEAEGQPVAEIAEAAAQGAEITAELNGQVLTITAHEPENMETGLQRNRRTPQGAGRSRQGLRRRTCCISERTQLRLRHRRLHHQQDWHGIRPGK